mgnify:CR=1 FL=1
MIIPLRIDLKLIQSNVLYPNEERNNVKTIPEKYLEPFGELFVASSPFIY